MTNPTITNKLARSCFARWLLVLREDINSCNRKGYTATAAFYRTWIVGARSMANDMGRLLEDNTYPTWKVTKR